MLSNAKTLAQSSGLVGMTLLLAANAFSQAQISSITVGTWTRIDLPSEDVRYLEALQGQNVLFWRGSGNVLRRVTYTWDGTTVVLGTITTSTGLTSGDHPAILDNGGGNLEGYFHPGTGPSSPTQYHAVSTDNGVTWSSETSITYPFPTPTLTDSGTTGGGGIIEVSGQRRIYAQNNFGDVVFYTTTAGSAGPLTSVGLLINGLTGNFQNQSPSGDAIQLPTGEVLYFYTDGEGSEATLGAVGVLVLNAAGSGFTDQEDNFVTVSDAGLVVAGMTQLDEMTVNNVQVSGTGLSCLLFLCGDSVANGSAEDIYYAKVDITFDVPVPVSLASFVVE